MKKIKSEKAYPGAKRLIESLSDLGYETHTAIADLVDNSISAKASKVFIDIVFDEKEKPFVFIADDGFGMNRAELLQAMRFGAFQEYDGSSLGKYGLGLKTASLSQCRCLTVISKPKPEKGSRPKVSIARWDLDEIEKGDDDWDLLFPEVEDLKPCEQQLVEKYIGAEHGTIVIWSNLRDGFSDLTAKNNIVRDEFFSALLNDILNHVSMVFHRFIEGTVPKTKKLKLFVSDNEVEGWDPFCRKESKTQEYDVEIYKIKYKDKNYEVVVSPFNIPREDEFSSKEAFKKAKGHMLFNNHQGFYYYRSGRLLKMGGWSGMRINDEHTKLTRVAVDFPNELDELFSINITKMKAKIPTPIFEDLKSDSAKWVADGRKRYDKKARSKASSKSSKGSASSAPSPSPKDYKMGRFTITPSSTSNKATVITVPRGGENITISVSPSSPLYPLVSGSSSTNGELRKLVFILLSYLENIRDGKRKAQDVPFDYLLKRAKELI